MTKEEQNNKLGTQGSGNSNVSIQELGLDAEDLKNSTSTEPKEEGSQVTTITETPEQKLVKEQVEKLSTEDKTKYNSLSDIEKTNFLKEKSTNSSNSGNQGAEIKAVQIDGIEYKLDDKGNAIDDKGVVVKTKVEIDKLVSEQEHNEEPLVVSLQKLSGIVPKDENGKVIVYEDTEEGIIKWNNDVAEIKANAKLKAYLERFPDVADYAKARQQGKTAEEYFKRQSTSWSNTKLDSTNKEQLKEVIIDSYIKDGWSKADADKSVKLYEDSDQLKTFGEAAYNKLVKAEKTAIANEEDNYKRRVIEYEEQVTKQWEAIKQTVEKGTLGNISIPEADRVQFFNYIATPIDEKGNSARDIAYSKLTDEGRLQLDFLLFKGLNIKSLIEANAKSQNVINLRSKMRGDTGAGKGEGNERQSNSPNSLDISLETFK